MTEEITVEQALNKLDQIAEEWVERDLEKGIALPFRHWPLGLRKRVLNRILWRNVIVPLVFGLIVLTCAIMSEWKLFAILLVLYVLYWVIGVCLCRREKGSFILKIDGITIVTSNQKLYVPWEAVTDIESNCDGIVYTLMIKTPSKIYTYYEEYAKTLVVDGLGQVNPAMMPLHIAYKLMTVAYQRVNKV